MKGSVMNKLLLMFIVPLAGTLLAPAAAPAQAVPYNTPYPYPGGGPGYVDGQYGTYGAYGGYDSYGATVPVPYAPPPTPYEVQPPAPGPGFAWVPGRWQWNGAQYLWIAGQWTLPPAYGAAWVGPRWVPYTHRWSPGWWRPGPTVVAPPVYARPVPGYGFPGRTVVAPPAYRPGPFVGPRQGGGWRGWHR
jgi:hypothetical protein